MSDAEIEQAKRNPERRRMKREIVWMFVAAGALVVFGAAWTMMNGEQRDPDVQGPAVVYEEGPATMPGPAAMPEHRPGDAPPPSAPAAAR